MIDPARFPGLNAEFVQDLYERFQKDPDSIAPADRAWFDINGDPYPTQAAVLTSSPAVPPSLDVEKIVLAARVARMIRERGHLLAALDPLGSTPPGDPALELSTHGLTEADLRAMPAAVVSGPLATSARDALEAISRLRKAYSGSVGYEDDHVQSREEREWIREAAETGRFFNDFTDTSKREVLQRLTKVDTFEQFLNETFQAQKRFSIEGTDMLVPMLDSIIHHAAMSKTREVTIGMPHRGRLNVLAHILGKPYSAILAEFTDMVAAADNDADESMAAVGGGDVKYHLGARVEYTSGGVDAMPISLAPNPSHLEFVNPVVVGRARAAQEDCLQSGKPAHDMHASLAILIHGDAAFPGQGIVAETLNLSRLPGYRVGGTIHIIANNQIGFTTDPSDGRSTLYASDLAKGFEIPIIHVNSDDTEACIAVARMAAAYHQKFAKDVLIDLVGYRRYGHNEGDEPAFTQPQMYRTIRNHPRVREIWAEELVRRGTITAQAAAEMVANVRMVLQSQMEHVGRACLETNGHQHGAGTADVPPTKVSKQSLLALNQALLRMPTGFTLHPRIAKVLERRAVGIGQQNGIDWGHAESLAFASISADGTPIRLTGQDTERGTFGHRNAVLHDAETGAAWCPLQNFPQSRGSFALYNSPLSENAALGFEYGYSTQAKNVLVIWEAQFGDFANSAQVIIDQFIAPGRAKWHQSPSLTLLLPHGYEGSGPEHSSARLERFLQLAADGNMRIANCTTAGQYFHVLRRQAAMLKTEPCPLIVMTPKSLLRHPAAAVSVTDLSNGSFEPVLDDSRAAANPKRVSRIVLCSGKIWTELTAGRKVEVPSSVALIRVEELYPFPTVRIHETISQYDRAEELVWLQEEPKNMGAYTYVAPILQKICKLPIQYIGRAESASPAEGSHTRHDLEQNRILNAVVAHIPALRLQRNGVRHAS